MDRANTTRQLAHTAKFRAIISSDLANPPVGNANRYFFNSLITSVLNPALFSLIISLKV